MLDVDDLLRSASRDGWLGIGTQMTARPMKARDIADADFCRAIEFCQQRRGLIWAMEWDMRHVLSGHPERVGNYSGVWDDEIPVNLFRAKARRLISRGLVDGCPCGCRGDYELVSQIAPLTAETTLEGTNFCDRCGRDMRGLTGWMEPTGRWDSEFNAPIVEMVCNHCHNGHSLKELT